MIKLDSFILSAANPPAPLRLIYYYQRGSNTDHGLHGGAGDHELHLLRQHGGGRLLLDQVVPPVDLQLCLEVGRRVEVLAVLPRAAALVGRRRRKFRSLKTSPGRAVECTRVGLAGGPPVISSYRDVSAALLHFQY